MEQYHKLSDEAMDTLLEDLEQLVEDHGDSSFEVEYHVCLSLRVRTSVPENTFTEWSFDP